MPVSGSGQGGRIRSSVETRIIDQHGKSCKFNILECLEGYKEVQASALVMEPNGRRCFP